MPRALDRHNIEPEGDPNRSGTEFHISSLQQGIDGLGGAIGDAIEYFKTQIVEIINNLTGIDLTSWDTFFASLFDGKGIDFLWVVNIVQKIFNAFLGINLDGAPGAIADFVGHLVGDTVGNIIEVFTGIEDGDLNDLGTWINTHIREPIEEAAAAFAAVLGKIFMIDDLIEVISGKEDGDTTDVGSMVNGIIDGIQSTVDVIVKALFGWLGNGFSHDDAQQALQDEAATVAALSSAVQALQNNQNNQNVGGKSAFVDFSIRPNQTGMGTDFDVAYTGAGTSYYAIQDGDVVMVPGGNNPRTGLFRYNLLETTTDYQKVGCAFSSAPERGTSNPSHNYIHGRKNAAGTTYVYAELSKDRVELGCVVGGTKTVFTSTTSFSFKANSNYWLECGTVGGQRIFRVLENNTPVLAHTEVGTTSQVGAGFRGTGGGAYIFGSGFGFYNIPAKMLAFAMADNQPPTVVGSGSVITRTTTSNVNVTSGNNLLPNNFWNSPQETTADITVDFTTGKMTASIAGWYQVSCSVALNPSTTATNFPNDLALYAYRSGTQNALLARVGKWIGTQTTSAGDTRYGRDIPSSFGGSALIYLDAGQYVQIGYYSPSSETGILTGSAGLESQFSLALVNRSLA